MLFRSEDGSYVITDSEGKYDFYGISAKTHVLKVDRTTLPIGSELVLINNRQAGDPNSRFVDVSQLFGAKLTFDHRLTQKNNITTVTITQTLDGIFAPIWAKILGKDQQADLEKSTAKLIAKAETQ